MAVLVEGVSVIIRAEAIFAKFPGGWEKFKLMVPNQTLCADSEVVRVGFMDPNDVRAYLLLLKDAGIEHLKDEEALDIVVVDQLQGPTSQCSWIEFGHICLNNNQNKMIGACRLVGSRITQVVTPEGWDFERSLSYTYGYVPSGRKQEGLKFLCDENGLDVYYDSLSEKEVYIGRSKRELNKA